MSMFDNERLRMQHEAWTNAVHSAHNQSAISSTMIGSGGGALGMGTTGIAGHGGVRMSRGLEVEFGIEVARIDNGWLVRLRGSEKLTYCASAEDVGKVIVARLVDRRMNGDDEKVEEAQAALRRVKMPKLSDPIVEPEQYGTITYSDNTA